MTRYGVDYLHSNDEIGEYTPYPKFLYKLKDTSLLAKEMYSLILSRATLSQMNGWCDNKNRVYIIYPQKELQKELNRGETAIKNALKELERNNLIQREKVGFAKPDRIYVMMYFKLE